MLQEGRSERYGLEAMSVQFLPSDLVHHMYEVFLRRF
jgi:hypothetical protein